MSLIPPKPQVCCGDFLNCKIECDPRREWGAKAPFNMLDLSAPEIRTKTPLGETLLCLADFVLIAEHKWRALPADTKEKRVLFRARELLRKHCSD